MIDVLTTQICNYNVLLITKKLQAGEINGACNEGLWDLLLIQMRINLLKLRRYLVKKT